jgi:DNA-directed RNA polymerase subunit RPC12/RpoP
MTFEKKCLIEPSDFISVQYECANCHAAILVPIDKLNPEQAASLALAGCRYCQTPSGFQPSTSEMKAFLDFNICLKQFIELSQGRNLKMRLGIKCPE